jgi:lantibiotic modifying enzyme
VLLDEEEPVERARLMLRRFNPALAKGEPDLLSGRAGAIVALLLLREELGEDDLLDRAAVLGDQLLRIAEKEQTGFSWRAEAHKFPYNLTGFSHGTAGIGYALLELHAATREAKYRQGAEEAFAYGRSWFDRDEANWPDLRSVQKRTPRKQLGRLPYVSYWCHGAPGIGLSRLRAYQLLGDDLYREEAQYALETTRRAVDAALRAGAEAGDFSLCHGVPGLAQILLYGRQILGQGWSGSDTSALVAQVARLGVEQQATAGGGHTPGLMVGQAGTGLFYLSLTNPTMPVLFPSMLEWKNTA